MGSEKLKSQAGVLTPQERMEQYLNDKYCLRLNQITGRVEYKVTDTCCYVAMSDIALNSLHRELNKAGIKVSQSSFRNTLLSDFTPAFNPFHEYLFNLPPWEAGDPDFISQLSETVSTTNPDLWRRSFKKWFVALVGSLIEDNVVNHTLIVFSGAQGVGKTTWMLNLIPPQLKDYGFSGMINPGNKDTIIQLAECMLINLDELESLNRTDVSVLKEIITKSHIRIRRPYGYSSELMPRRASFAGSVNNKEFLNDITGSRRFLCFEVKEINYKHTIDMDMVYSQAVSLFRAGFQYWFDQQEISEIQANNDQYRTLSTEEELLLTYFERCEKNEADYLLSATEVISLLRERVRVTINNSSKEKIGRALRAHNFLRIKHGGRYVYALKALIKIEQPQILQDNHFDI